MSQRLLLPRQPPSLALLLLCSRLHLSAGVTSRIGALVRDGIDWDNFLSLVFRNSTGPAVYRNLAGAFSEHVPAHILQSLKEHVYRTAAHNFALSNSLLAALRTLSEAGVRAMPLKGPVLAASYYGQLSLRDFEDLDILVDPRDLLRANHLLAGLGFEPRSHDAIDPTLLKRGKHLVLRHPSTGVIVELHWALFEAALHCRFAPESLWQSAESVTLLGEQVPSLGPEDQFLFLATHGWRHGWESLKWICDIAELIHSCPDHQWASTLRRAEEMGCLRIALLALALASELLEAPLPDQILSLIQAEPEVADWLEEIRAKLGDTSIEAEQPGAGKALAGAGFVRFQMRSRDRLLDRVSLFAHEIGLHLRPNRADQGGGWITRPFRLARIYGLRCFASSSKALFSGLFHIKMKVSE